MGAEPWRCYTKYEDDTSRALDRLRELEFESGRYRYAEEAPSSIDEALEIADADVTALILDISQVLSTPNFGYAVPLATQFHWLRSVVYGERTSAVLRYGQAIPQR